MKMELRFLAGLILSLAFFSSGCGKVVKKTVITGVVSYDGKPIKGGVIGFVAADGVPVQADVQPDGTYRIENVPLGECIVLVHAPTQDEAARHKVIKETALTNSAPPPPPPPPFPTKYSDMGTTDLRYTVVVGDNVYNPDMKR